MRVRCIVTAECMKLGVSFLALWQLQTWTSISLLVVVIIASATFWQIDQIKHMSPWRHQTEDLISIQVLATVIIIHEQRKLISGPLALKHHWYLRGFQFYGWIGLVGADPLELWIRSCKFHEPLCMRLYSSMFTNLSLFVRRPVYFSVHSIVYPVYWACMLRFYVSYLWRSTSCVL